MITYTKLQAIFIYFYTGLYALAAVFAFFSGLFGGDESLMGLAILFAPLAYVLHLFAQAHFRLARRAANYLEFCKAVGIDNDKERSVQYFAQYKKN